MSERTRRAPVTVDDLSFAADWMEAYEGQDDDDNNAAAARVAAWLRAEITRRAEAAAVRKLAAETGADPARCREALRRQIARR